MDKFYNVSTKVSLWVKKQFARLCRKKEMTEYEMLQMAIDCLVRYMDDRHNLQPELERAMSVFEHLIGWKDAYNLADPTIDREVCEAIYITCDKEGKKHGFRAHYMQKPWMGEWIQTDNITDIFNRVVEVLLPDINWKLRQLAREMGAANLVEMLHILIDADTIRDLNGEVRRECADAARADNGRVYEYGARTKAKQYRSPDSIANDGRIHFDDYDATTTDHGTPVTADDVEDAIGCQPFGCEA